MTRYFAQEGASPGAAHDQAMGFVGHLVETQATIMAYIDVFQLCAIVAAVMIPIVLIMVRRVQLGQGSMAGH